MRGRLVIGLGLRTVATAQELFDAVSCALAEVDPGSSSLGAGDRVAIWDRHRDHPAVTGLLQLLDRPLRPEDLSVHSAEALASQPVSQPSARVGDLTSRSATTTSGLASVAEAAVLACGAQVVLPKRSYRTCTVAIGRLPGPATATEAVTGAAPVPDPVDSVLDLAHHGDAELGPGLVDFAVNVAVDAPPRWLARTLAAAIPALAAYPAQEPIRRQLADALGVSPGSVLLVNGAAEAFTLLAQARAWQRPVVVHPQFTEPEAALAAAGYRVRRHLLDAEGGFRLNPGSIDPEADLIIVGNPTNPTSRLHSRDDLLCLRAAARVLVVDEAFMDVVPGEQESLLPRLREESGGVLVVRSLTKTFGLAGLRAGFIVGDPDLVEQLRRVQPPWSVNSLALAALEASLSADAIDHVQAVARRLAVDRAHLVSTLTGLGLDVVADPAGPFVLAHHPRAAKLREALRRRGFAIRRADTFPGLSSQWLRLAARGPASVDALGAAIADSLDRAVS